MDLMSLTPAELGIAQRKAKLTKGILGVLGDESDAGWVDAVVGLSWVVQRREDPTLTYESVADMSLSALIEVLGIDTAEAEDADAGERDAPTE